MLAAIQPTPLAPVRTRLDLNPVEPARFNLRHATRIDLNLIVALRNYAGEEVNPTDWNLLFVLLPRSERRAMSFGMEVFDAANGLVSVSVPGEYLYDPNGYRIEVYSRAVPEGGGNPSPRALLARGIMSMDGLTYSRALQGGQPTVEPEPAPLPEVIASWSAFQDGAAQIVEPAFQKLLFTQTLGNAAQLNGDDIEFTVSGDGQIEFSVEVKHNWGSQVIFGYTINGADFEELGRVTVEANDFILVTARFPWAFTAGDVVQLYISSNFEYAEFAWQNGQVLTALIEEGP